MPKALTFPEGRPHVADWVKFTDTYTDPGGWIWRLCERERADDETWYLALADINLYVGYSKPITDDRDWPWDRWGIGSGGAPLDKGYETKDEAMLAARPQLEKLVKRRMDTAERELGDARALIIRLATLELP